MDKDDVRQKYEEFQVNYPEGEITKEQFLMTMKVFKMFRMLIECARTLVFPLKPPYI